jgi:hypothetical protein
MLAVGRHTALPREYARIEGSNRRGATAAFQRLIEIENAHDAASAG